MLSLKDIAEVKPSELSLRALEALAQLSWQIDMGADEILLDTPVDRFQSSQDELEAMARRAKAKSKSSETPSTQSKSSQTDTSDAAKHFTDYGLEFSKSETLDTLFQQLQALAPSSLTKMARQVVPSLGVRNAEILVLVDPPSREAERAGALITGPKMKLVDAAFQAVGLCHRDVPIPNKRFDIAIHPLSPWRPPQDRALDNEELQCLSAYWARYFVIASPKLVLMQGDRLQGLLRQVENDKIFGVNVQRLISPSVMLADWRLKRDHWHALLEICARLKGNDNENP